MNIQKFTQKSMEAINEAKSLSLEYGNPAIEEAHLLFALINDESGLVPQLFIKMGCDVAGIKRETLKAIEALPKLGNKNDNNLYISNTLELSLNQAEKTAASMKDEYVSVEHIVLGMIEKKSDFTKKLFTKYNVTKAKFLEALQTVRGNSRVTSDNPEDTYDVLKKYGSDLVELARMNKLDP